MGSRICFAVPALAAGVAAIALAFEDARGSVLSISGGARATQLTLPFSGTVNTSTAIAFHVIQSGTAPGGRFSITNPGNGNFALEGVTAGSGHAILGWNNGTGHGAVVLTSNSANTRSALDVTSASLGSPTDPAAADIFATNSSATAPAVRVRNRGQGAVLKLEHVGTTGDIATFDTSTVNKARISREGRGVFAGGIRTAGHGVTEAIKPDGAVSSYARGDVLIVSTSGDAHVKKSSSTYARSVIGVVAGDNGVALTDQCINCSLSSLLSVGILGVFPVKVSAQNGMVHRGDLLATSSTPGAAMRATSFAPGTILGKSLGSFSGSGTAIVPALISLQ
jgi:hypothetical protein